MVEVRLYATLRRYAPAASKGVFPVEIAADTTVAQLVNAINMDVTEIHIIMINGVGSTMHSTLYDGDRLGLFPPVGGG